MLADGSDWTTRPCGMRLLRLFNAPQLNAVRVGGAGLKIPARITATVCRTGPSIPESPGHPHLLQYFQNSQPPSPPFQAPPPVPKSSMIGTSQTNRAPAAPSPPRRPFVILPPFLCFMCLLSPFLFLLLSFFLSPLRSLRSLRLSFPSTLPIPPPYPPPDKEWVAGPLKLYNPRHGWKLVQTG